MPTNNPLPNLAQILNDSQEPFHLDRPDEMSRGSLGQHERPANTHTSSAPAPTQVDAATPHPKPSFTPVIPSTDPSSKSHEETQPSQPVIPEQPYHSTTAELADDLFINDTNPLLRKASRRAKIDLFITNNRP